MQNGNQISGWVDPTNLTGDLLSCFLILNYEVNYFYNFDVNFHFLKIHSSFTPSVPKQFLALIQSNNYTKYIDLEFLLSKYFKYK